MGLFEQQFSGEQIAAARQWIAAGGSLRAAAAQIGCAPLDPSRCESRRLRPPKPTLASASASAIASRLRRRAGAPPSRPRAALVPARGRTGGGAARRHAGDQGERAARLAGPNQRRPRLGNATHREAEPELDLEPETIVYDLPSGSTPILHRAPLPFSGPGGQQRAAGRAPPEPGHYFLQHERAACSCS